jgi:antitoxin (DNA-binding transcriptional repressor) of toxin-antitoxin stability system
MSTITLSEAQARLPELIGQLIPGEEVGITRANRLVARLIAEPPPIRADDIITHMELAESPMRDQGTPIFGNCKDMATIVADDDEHLEDFAEYM